MRVRRNRRRAGNILVLTALMMVLLMALLAFAVDLGYVYTANAELKRSADAAALAAAWELLDESAAAEADGLQFQPSPQVRLMAAEYAGNNSVTGRMPVLGEGDVAIGQLPWPAEGPETLSFADPHQYNAVRVRIRKDTGQNGQVPLFFARVLGQEGWELSGEATAMFYNNFSGFQKPSNGQNLDILPFALDVDTWNGLLAGRGEDNWKWNEETEAVQQGCDGVLEVNLYPQGTGSPGNRGTVDIGSSNNSTNDICRQVLEGVSPQDLDHHGGKLALDDNGELFLNGDTGISAGVKEELDAIRGQPRIIPIFREVHGPGNNAQYTIIQFAGVRIMEVKLTGKMTSKRVIIQPARVSIQGGIPAGDGRVSHFVYSPVWLVR